MYTFISIMIALGIVFAGTIIFIIGARHVIKEEFQWTKELKRKKK